MIDENTLNELFRKSRTPLRLQKATRSKILQLSLDQELELVAITAKSDNEGILIIYLDNVLWLRYYQLKKRVVNSNTGRSRGLTCDFCFMWQKGESAANLTFVLDEKRTVSYLVCGNLECSSNVRGLTVASRLSKTQLRDNATTNQRVQRLRSRLSDLIEVFEA